MIRSAKEIVAIKEYPEETAIVAGKEERLSKLSKTDVEIFVDTLDRLAFENALLESERQWILQNADLILDVVRMVNINTKQGFKGPYARGNELTLVVMRAKDLLGTETWYKTYTSTGAQTYIPESTLAEEEAEIHLGVTNEYPNPKVDAILYTKDGDPLVRKHLNWEDTKEPFIPFEEAIIVGPEHSRKIDVNVNQVGVDATRVLVLKVVQAKNLMSL